MTLKEKQNMKKQDYFIYNPINSIQCLEMNAEEIA